MHKSSNMQGKGHGTRASSTSPRVNVPTRFPGGLMTTPVGNPLIKHTYLASSTTSTSACAVMGALECAPVGSSTFSSPLVELTT